MNVYIVETGGNCEDGRILGVFTTFESARGAALKWVKTVTSEGLSEWSESDSEIDADGNHVYASWASDFEWASVRAHSLQTPANAPAIAFASAPEPEITDLVTTILDDAAAAGASDVARALADELVRLSHAAKCRAAAIGLRFDGCVNMALSEERVAENLLRTAEAQFHSRIRKTSRQWPNESSKAT